MIHRSLISLKLFDTMQANLATATSLHERHLELAQVACIPEEQEVANAALMQARGRLGHSVSELFRRRQT